MVSKSSGYLFPLITLMYVMRKMFVNGLSLEKCSFLAEDFPYFQNASENNCIRVKPPLDMLLLILKLFTQVIIHECYPAHTYWLFPTWQVEVQIILDND